MTCPGARAKFTLNTTGTLDVGGQGGQLPTQVLADQLTLYQPEGADCVPHITTSPPNFR